MSRKSVSEVLAGAAASMVTSDHDVTGSLATLLGGVADVVPADAAAVLVRTENGPLDVLAATSHRVVDLEIYQVQVDEGPCVETIRTGSVVEESGAERIVARWPTAGPVIVAAGYAAVHATPLHWRGHCFGALNVFRVEPDGEGSVLTDCQPLADAATMLIVSTHVAEGDLLTSLREALEARAVVERAKGALAHVRSIDVPSAFDALHSLATEEHVSLGEAARRVMERALLGTLA